MSIGGYKIRDPVATHFLTFAVFNWIDVFTRQTYRDIVVDSLKYCQREKELKLNAWCLMSNHVKGMKDLNFGKTTDSGGL